MTEHAVAIAGGGPTGMMLAAELALAKVDVAIFEQRADRASAGEVIYKPLVVLTVRDSCPLR